MVNIGAELPLDHIGIATGDLEASIQQYSSLLGLSVVHREVAPSGEVELCFLALAQTRIELIAPYGPTGGPLKKFLETRGPGLHHLCYRVPDIVGELARLKSLGVRLIDEKPRPGAHGSIIAFLHPSAFGGVLTELCQY